MRHDHYFLLFLPRFYDFSVVFSTAFSFLAPYLAYKESKKDLFDLFLIAKVSYFIYASRSFCCF